MTPAKRLQHMVCNSDREYSDDEVIAMSLCADAWNDINALRAENKRLHDALEPFATADADCVAVGIRPEDTYLWKPQSNTREMRGIHMGHILAARDALANKTGESK